jgi:hypothetical protein
MATSNINITNAWTKIADASNAELLVTWNAPVWIEVATTVADSAPVVSGHRLAPESAITRTIIGAGYVWAKVVASANSAAMDLVVSK